ncbi:MAG: tyrosine-type recombinase/integrase [Mycobacteriaceae bacterium]
MDNSVNDALATVGFLRARERWDQTSYAVASFLARYRDLTLRAYRQDLRAFLTWCAERDLAPLEAERPHLELYLRWMEARGLAPATIARRFGTVAGFYKYAVLDGHLPVNPTLAVTRPRVAWEAQRRTVLHPLEYAALLTAARHDGPSSHALVALLGMLGLRVSEACQADIADLHYDSGYELLTIIGKGRKPAQLPLPVPVLRAVHDATADRQAGPILLNRRGIRMTPAAAASRLRRLTRAIGLKDPISPHSLRRTFCTAGLVSGVPLRDMQYAMRHSDSRTTLRYVMSRTNLDRHAAHPVAAYLAGMAAE